MGEMRAFFPERLTGARLTAGPSCCVSCVCFFWLVVFRHRREEAERQREILQAEMRKVKNTQENINANSFIAVGL